jgi:hypothetical protein
VVQRLARTSLKDNYRFSLVRDAEAEDLLGDRAIPLKEQSARLEGILIDLLRVMLNPPGLRIVLLMLDRCLVNKLATGIKEQSFCRGGALVQGKDERHRHLHELRIWSAVSTNPLVEIP